MPTEDNLADVASLGGEITSEKWLTGTKWESDRDHWPQNRVVEKSQASEIEAKVVKNVLGLAQQQINDSTDNVFENLLT